MEPKLSLTVTTSPNDVLYRLEDLSQESQPNYTSWFAAMMLLNRYSKEDARDWIEIALPLQTQLSKLDPKDKEFVAKRVAALYQFLSGESEKPENKDLKFSMKSPSTRSFADSVSRSDRMIRAEKGGEVYLTLREDAVYLHSHKFHLVRSEWTPRCESSTLIFQLKKSGPMIMFGRFGESCYKEKPSELPSKVLGERVFAWKRGAERASQQLTSAIVVIGALISGEKSRVFFVDPKTHSTDRRIYIISFTNLMANITAVDGELFSKSGGIDKSFVGSRSMRINIVDTAKKSSGDEIVRINIVLPASNTAKKSSGDEIVEELSAILGMECSKSTYAFQNSSINSINVKDS